MELGQCSFFEAWTDSIVVLGLIYGQRDGSSQRPSRIHQRADAYAGECRHDDPTDHLSAGQQRNPNDGRSSYRGDGRGTERVWRAARCHPLPATLQRYPAHHLHFCHPKDLLLSVTDPYSYQEVKRVAERDLGVVTQCFVATSAGIGMLDGVSTRLHRLPSTCRMPSTWSCSVSCESSDENKS